MIFAGGEVITSSGGGSFIFDKVGGGSVFLASTISDSVGVVTSGFIFDEVGGANFLGVGTPNGSNGVSGEDHLIRPENVVRGEVARLDHSNMGNVAE